MVSGGQDGSVMILHGLSIRPAGPYSRPAGTGLSGTIWIALSKYVHVKPLLVPEYRVLNVFVAYHVGLREYVLQD